MTSFLSWVLRISIVECSAHIWMCSHNGIKVSININKLWHRSDCHFHQLIVNCGIFLLQVARAVTIVVVRCWVCKGLSGFVWSSYYLIQVRLWVTGWMMGESWNNIVDLLVGCERWCYLESCVKRHHLGQICRAVVLTGIDHHLYNITLTWQACACGLR